MPNAAHPARRVPDHEVVVVQQVLLVDDPSEADPECLAFCQIAPLLGIIDLLRAAAVLMLQAFPEVLEEREVADLKTSLIWETTEISSPWSVWLLFEPRRGQRAACTNRVLTALVRTQSTSNRPR